MLKNIFFVLLLVLCAEAKDGGLNQTHLVSVSPEINAQAVTADSSVEIEFDLPISKSSLHKKALVLKNSKHKKIEGTLGVKNNNTLIFTPNKDLESGEYKVKVKGVNLQDYTPNTNFKRYTKKFCSYFYDDVKKCRLYNYASKVKTKPIKYSFRVDASKPKVINLSLSKSNIQLNEDNTTTIHVNAKYDNNETLDVTNEVEWIISNPNIISVDKYIITPVSEGTTTLQAKLNNQTTAQISVSIYKEINGYKLPPEPDPVINSSTLLGIDINNNGVRDDVERKIIETYREPVQIELMMDMAEVGQMILENPVGDALVNQKKISRIGDCGMYLRRQKQRPSNYIDFYENNMYNTKQRVRAYLDYNLALSGGVYGSSPSDWTADSCDYDVDAMLGATK